MCKHTLKENVLCAKVSCVCSSHSLRACTRVQQLRGNIGHKHCKGPSIYDVHTEGGGGSGSGGRMWMGGAAPSGRPHRKLKLESTDVILSSSHAKKLASFLPEFRLWTEKSGHFSAI